MSIRLSSQARETILSEAARHYPHECCGLLAGSGAEITAAFPVENVEKDRRHDRFVLDPVGYIEADRRAAEAGLSIVGIYHSHPDHPARPSETDRGYAAPWEGYVWIIVSVVKGNVERWGAFLMENERFHEREILFV